MPITNNCPVSQLMTYIDTNKEKLADGIYVDLCNTILKIKKHHEHMSADISRLKKKQYQRQLILDCVVDYITEREYDSDDETIFLRFSQNYEE